MAGQPSRGRKAYNVKADREARAESAWIASKHSGMESGHHHVRVGVGEEKQHSNAARGSEKLIRDQLGLLFSVDRSSFRPTVPVGAIRVVFRHAELLGELLDF